ncbi:acetate--CoA ligase family protein [Frigidibacter sp. MR17.24]|uniref:acetate--CoA ligase family protein n=1 Tax=Frigidibacter sp. MR17.24 TaxID=3127345 RepID=UPI003012DF7A
MAHPLAALMAPGSVAVVGATERPGASAGYVMRNLAAMGYGGAILPVHPREARVFGHAAAPSLSALTVTPDCVVVGIGAPHVPAILDEAGARGVKAAVVLASGFGETGAEGAALEAEMAAIARRHGMALCGPNCLGLVSLAPGAALYSSTLAPGMRRGGVALISASGASAIALAHSGRFGVSAVVSMGNASVTGLGDYLDWFAQDPQTRTVGLVIEGIRDPEGLARGMAAIHAAGKTALALRVGRTAAGQRATAAHTGALAGAAEAQAALLDRLGIVDLPDMDSFAEAAALCEAGLRPPRGPVAVVGVSGGGIAHVSDIASDCGLPLATLAPATVDRLRALLPGFATPQNPLDLTGAAFGDADVYAQALAALDADPGVAAIIAAQDAPPGLSEAIAEEYLGIAGAIGGYGGATPVVAMANLSAGHHPRVAAAFGTAARLHGTRATLTAIAALQRGARGISWTGAAPAQPLPCGDLGEAQARAIFEAEGIGGPRGAVVAEAAAAGALAERLGFPVVMKIASPDIAHKTEAGGVALNLTDRAAVEAAFGRITAAARAHAPAARIDGVLVQEMVTGGVEVLLGLVQHAPFGLGMVAGIGGTLTELVGEAAFDLLPVDAARAGAMIDRTRLGALLAGQRGAPPADRAALVAAMVALSDFGMRHGTAIEAVDLNPVAVLPEGRGLRLLDALILRA